MRYLYIGKTNAKGYRTAIKIGISKDSNKRWKDIDRSVSNSIEWPIFSGRVFFAQKLETSLHRKYSQYRVEFKGSGKTEWFKMPVLLRAKVIFEVAAMIIISQMFVILISVLCFWILLSLVSF